MNEILCCARELFTCMRCTQVCTVADTAKNKNVSPQTETQHFCWPNITFVVSDAKPIIFINGIPKLHKWLKKLPQHFLQPHRTVNTSHS